VQEVTQVGIFMLDAARGPMRKWHLRHTHDPVAYAMRMLMFDDAISRAEAENALGDVPLDAFVGAGFITGLEDENYVSPFNLNLVGNIFVICDHLSHGNAAVMGAGQTTTFMCEASRPSLRLRGALDVGCGAGTGALSLAAHADRVIGTDINPRAVALSRLKERLSVALQGANGAVLDGRDIGTVVCPDAAVKLFVTASAESRAKRRVEELRSLRSHAASVKSPATRT